MRRTFVVLGLTGVLALAGCGLRATGAATPASDVTDAAIALQQVGFETGLADESSAGTGDAPRKQLRRYLRKNTLHGEVAVETRKNGVQTVVVQRGAVTAVSGGSVSVKSSDGFALTWTLADATRIVQDRRVAERSALKTGTEIGIAGVKDGSATTARLIAIK